jgi:taurine dioxygenase
MQTDLMELSAVHDLGSFRNSYAKDGNIRKGYDAFDVAVHPVVRDHPVTGQPCLFVNEAFTMHIVGMMADESRRLLDYLFSHLQRPDLQVRWNWQEGDCALWDNRSTQHYACADYMEHRRMHRVTIIDDKLGTHAALG